MRYFRFLLQQKVQSKQNENDERKNPPKREKQHVEMAAVEAETAVPPMEMMMRLFHYYSVVEQGVAAAAAAAADSAALPREMQPRWLPRVSFVADKKPAVTADYIAAAATVVDAAAMVVVAAAAAAAGSSLRMDYHRLRSWRGPQKDLAADTTAAAAPSVLVAVARLSSRCQTHRRDWT